MWGNRGWEWLGGVFGIYYSGLETLAGQLVGCHSIAHQGHSVVRGMHLHHFHWYWQVCPLKG